MPAAPSSFAARAVRWQRDHGRHGLPWQDTRDPYRVWLSEVMLQQTQVATVLRYYDAFLACFPTVQALAAASPDSLMAAWSGLGYYSRARNLHRCAQQVVAQHGGRFPTTAQALAQLPGIGRTTANAIAAFCFGERVPILDANVRRVLSRHAGIAGDPSTPAVQQQLWDAAFARVPARGASMPRYTQAMMDLGSLVCLPRRPRCDACPVAADCVARLEQRQGELPGRRRGAVRRRLHSAWLWLEHDGAVWVVTRPPRGIWAGLTVLPMRDDAVAFERLLDDAQVAYERLATVEHVLTHRDWTITTVHARLPPGAAGRAAAERLTAALRADAATAAPAGDDVGGDGRWLVREALGSAGIPSPLRELWRSRIGDARR